MQVVVEQLNMDKTIGSHLLQQINIIR